MPWTQPISMPAATTIIAATTQWTCRLTIRSMNNTPSSATTAPTDRSMPPVSTTNACATAMMPNSPIWFAVLEMLAGSTNLGLMIATMVPTTRISTSRPMSFLKITHGLRHRFHVRARCSVRSDGQPQDIVFAELRPLEHAADASLVHHRDAVAHADDLFHVG